MQASLRFLLAWPTRLQLSLPLCWIHLFGVSHALQLLLHLFTHDPDLRYAGQLGFARTASKRRWFACFACAKQGPDAFAPTVSSHDGPWGRQRQQRCRPSCKPSKGRPRRCGSRSSRRSWHHWCSWLWRRRLPDGSKRRHGRRRFKRLEVPWLRIWWVPAIVRLILLHV